MIVPKSLSGVVLSVKNVAKSLAWYREKFGFEKVCDDAPNSKGIIIGTNGITLALNPLDDPDNATDVDNAHQVCVQLFCLEIDEADLDRVATEFPEDKDIVVLDNHPKYRSRIIEDPDGHSIELIVWKHDCRTIARTGRAKAAPVKHTPDM
jgi:catechol 2,3-dioxygenase-like lactoylglutathione lyase family enzyme